MKSPCAENGVDDVEPAEGSLVRHPVGFALMLGDIISDPLVIRSPCLFQLLEFWSLVRSGGLAGSRCVASVDGYFCAGHAVRPQGPCLGGVSCRGVDLEFE